jgi:hypothetical protein
MVAEAVAVAARANVVVAVLGELAAMSGEAASRSEIGLSECQEQLLRALVKAGKPLVLVLMNGRPLTLTWEPGEFIIRIGGSSSQLRSASVRWSRQTVPTKT